MNHALSASWGAQARLTGVEVPLFGILLGYDLPRDHSRRRPCRQRGGARSRESRDSGAAAGDEAATPNPRASLRRPGRARVLQLAQEYEARQCGGAVEAGARRSGIAPHGRGAGVRRGGGRCARGGSDAVLPVDHRSGRRSSPDRAGEGGGARRGVAGERCRCSRARERAAHFRRVVVLAYGPDGERCPGLLRRRGSGGDGGFHRFREGVSPEPLRRGGLGRRLPERAFRERGVRAFHRRAARRRARHREGLRDPRAVPGMPADRGDRPIWQGRAALRQPEAGGIDRSAHGAPSLGGPAAARGGRMRPELQPGGLPDQPHLPRAASRVPDDSRLGAGGVRALRRHAPQYVHRRSALARRSGASANPRGRRARRAGVCGRAACRHRGLLRGHSLGTARRRRRDGRFAGCRAARAAP